VEWSALVQRAEKILGRPWTTMLEGRRDWGRDAVMYVAVRYGRYRLAEVVRRIEGLRYPAGAQAVRRFGERLARNPDMQRFVVSLRRELEKARK
jgi:hypothetical protein